MQSAQYHMWTKIYNHAKKSIHFEIKFKMSWKNILSKCKQNSIKPETVLKAFLNKMLNLLGNNTIELHFIFQEILSEHVTQNQRKIISNIGSPRNLFHMLLESATDIEKELNSYFIKSIFVIYVWTEQNISPNNM